MKNTKTPDERLVYLRLYLYYLMRMDDILKFEKEI